MNKLIASLIVGAFSAAAFATSPVAPVATPATAAPAVAAATAKAEAAPAAKTEAKKVGKEKIEGWFEEMALKTISRHAYNAITIDSKKIDDNYLAIIQKDNEMKDAIIQNDVIANANKSSLDFEEAEVVEEEVLQIEAATPESEVKEEVAPQLEFETTDKPGF